MYTFYGKTYTGTKGDILHIENICFGILPAYLCMWTLCVPGIYGVLKKFPIWSWSYTWLWPCCGCWELKTGLLQEDLTGNKCLDFWNLRILSQQHTSTKARPPNPFSSDSAFNWGSIQTQKLMGLFSFRLPQNLPKAIFQHGNLASWTRAVHSNHPLTLVKQFSVQQNSLKVRTHQGSVSQLVTYPGTQTPALLGTVSPCDSPFHVLPSGGCHFPTCPSHSTSRPSTLSLSQWRLLPHQHPQALSPFPQQAGLELLTLLPSPSKAGSTSLCHYTCFKLTLYIKPQAQTMASLAVLLGAGIKLCTLSGLYPFLASGHL